MFIRSRIITALILLDGPYLKVMVWPDKVRLSRMLMDWRILFTKSEKLKTDSTPETELHQRQLLPPQAISANLFTAVFTERKVTRCIRTSDFASKLSERQRHFAKRVEEANCSTHLNPSRAICILFDSRMIVRSFPDTSHLLLLEFSFSANRYADLLCNSPNSIHQHHN